MKKFYICLAVSILAIVMTGKSYGSINDGLLAYYPFDGNADDQSGNENHCTIYGATLTEDRFGKPNSAYSYGGDDYIQTPVDSNVLPLSFSVWFNAKSVSGERSIIDSDVWGHSGHSLIIGYWSGDGDLDVQYHNSYLDTEYSILEDEWYHVVVNYSDKIEVYINGEFIAERDYPTVSLDGSNFRFGRHNANDPQWFVGTIDDIRIYDRILTESEIQTLYNGYAVTPTEHDFGILPIDCISSKLFTLENKSGKSAEVGAPKIEGVGAPDLHIYGDACTGATLEPAETCTFEVSLEPTIYGSKDAELTISFTDSELFPIVVPLTGLVTENCECDLNEDHSCNILDYQVFIQDWGSKNCNDPGVECPCDLNSDGSCNILDYQLFIQDWGRDNCPVCPEP